MIRRVTLVAGAAVALLIGLFWAATALMPAPEESAGLSAAVRASSVFALSNKERSDEGVDELSLNPLLMRAAQLKAEDMATEAYYAHVSPDGETPMHWLDQVGYKYQYVGENLTANILEEEAVVSAWMGSPGHRRNLLDPKFEHMGVGVAEGTYKGKPALFVVQMLATPKPVVLPPTPKPPVVAPKPTEPIKTPPAKPIATPTPPAPKPLPETKIVEEVKELTKPITEQLSATTSIRLFSATTTEPVPFIISTSAVPIELRATGTAEQLPAAAEYHEKGKESSMTWMSEISSFVQRTIQGVGTFFFAQRS